jgi:signal transduction histidine kinase
LCQKALKKNLISVYIFFGLSIVVILAVFFLYSGKFQRLRDANREVKRTNAIIQQIQKLQSTIIEAENLEKSFLLTKKDTTAVFADLNKYFFHAKNLLDSLSILASHSRTQQQHIIKLKDDVSRRFTVLYDAIHQQLNHVQLIDVYDDKLSLIMGDFTRRIVLMETEEFERLNRLEEEQEHSETITPSYVEFILSLTIIFQAISFYLMVIEFKRRKKYEKDLEVKIAELNTSNSELEQITFVASHDLKEPLRKIRTFNDILVKHLREVVNESDLNHFHRIDQSATRMQELLDDLVDYTSLLRSEENMQKVSIEDIVSIAKQQLDPELKQTNAVITTTHLPIIKGYPKQLEILFVNLLQNSLKYSKPGIAPAIEIHAQIVRQHTTSNDEENGSLYQYLKVTISDNGTGFDDEFTDKIFMIFQRLQSPNSNLSGKGIGLAICKRIMLNHNGDIQAHSEAGKGASFDLLFPLYY